MPQMLLKQLGLWIAGQALMRAPALRNFIGEITLLVVAVLAAGFVGGALLVGLFYGEYLLLTMAAGLSHVPAFVITWLSAACLLLGSILLLQGKIRYVTRMLETVKRVQSPVAYYVDPILDSFINGFHDKPARRERKEAKEHASQGPSETKIHPLPADRIRKRHP